MDLLPEEVLADILGRLPPRPLAVCRSVCKDLRAVIDGRGLLLALAHRVPHSLRGMFINFVGQDRPYFFSRPADSTIDTELSFLLPKILWGEVVHHCNGLLLFQDWNGLYVCNPATRRWEELPPPPSDGSGRAHLAFDPTVSLHYDVFFFAKAPPKPTIPIQPGIKRKEWCKKIPKYTTEEIKKLPSSLRDEYDHKARIEGLVEWPPSLYMAEVFSSRTGKWEERAYAREDDVAVTLWDVWSDPWAPESGAVLYNGGPRCNAVHWRGAFYLHCRGGFILRLPFLEQKYQVIKTPKLDNIFMPPRLDVADFMWEGGSKEYCLSNYQFRQEMSDNLQPSMHLGKSEQGIYYTALRWHQLHVWVLQEASEFRPMPEWELKYRADIKPSFLQHYERVDRKIQECWMYRGQMGSEDSIEDCGRDSSDNNDINMEEDDDDDEEDEDDEEDDDDDEQEETKACWMLDHGQIGSEDNREDCEWDSSDDSGINVEEGCAYSNDRNYKIMDMMDFLGYHPSKEIAFLGNHFDGFAYYLGTSKLQYLGTFTPVGCCHFQVAATHESFIYTPCMDDLLPTNNMDSKDGGGRHISEDVDLDMENEDFKYEEEEEEGEEEEEDDAKDR